MYHLALCAIRRYIRGHEPCARIRCARSFRVHTYIRMCMCMYESERIRYRISLVVHSAARRCARAPLPFACLARKSRVHALLRARVCQVCVYRVPQRIATGGGEERRGEEGDTRHFVSRDDTLAPVICSLSRSLSRRPVCCGRTAGGRGEGEGDWSDT